MPYTTWDFFSNNAQQTVVESDYDEIRQKKVTTAEGVRKTKQEQFSVTPHIYKCILLRTSRVGGNFTVLTHQ